jgi:hypothetical protein
VTDMSERVREVCNVTKGKDEYFVCRGEDCARADAKMDESDGYFTECVKRKMRGTIGE